MLSNTFHAKIDAQQKQIDLLNERLKEMEYILMNHTHASLIDVEKRLKESEKKFDNHTHEAKIDIQHYMQCVGKWISTGKPKINDK